MFNNTLNTKRSGKRIKKIIRESIVIIFSVFLALFANEWRNNVKEDEQTQVILDNIKSEMKNNERVAENAMSYHRTVLDNIDSLKNSETLEKDLFNGYYFEDFKFAPKGIMRQGFNDIAWVVAKEERLATRISFQQSEALYEAYNQQSTIEETINRILHILYERSTHRAESTRENIVLMDVLFDELVWQEEQLLRNYKRVWKVLGEKSDD